MAAHYIGWVVAVCMIALALGIAGAIFILYRWSKDPKFFPAPTNEDITHPISPRVPFWLLFSFRVLWGLYCAGILATTFVHKPKPQVLVFFTIWNYILQIVYFLSVALYSVVVHRLQPNPRRDRIWNRVFFTVHHINVTCVFVVAVVFWTILFPYALKNHNHEVANFTSYNQHGSNVFAILLEFALNRMFIDARLVVFVTLWFMGYGMFAIFYQLGGGKAPYFFVQADKPATVAWLIGTVAIIVGFQLLSILVSKLKRRYYPVVVANEDLHRSLVA
eukprot:c1484_g1_i1.p1 GENE.c1484_g1_i1~~c1484_g1_i1.p1  ORF type:complete len:294 (+),score=64.41 c1484_g1_i1:57-884(+)